MLQKYWKTTAIALGFIGFILILAVTGGKSLFWNATAMGGLMIYFWLLEIIPIYVTALFPLIMAVPLGLADPEGLASSYGNSIVFLFLGGFIIALSLQKWEIHIQIARRILRLTGNAKPRIILGFLISTAFLSMWISNTATALMMLPMAVGILETLPEDQRSRRFSILLLLSIAYAANIGGIGTLVGSPPNTIMAGILEKEFNIKVNFFDWFKIGFPLCILFLSLAYLLFYLMLGKERKEKVENFSMEKKAWNINQLKVLAVFFSVVLLWLGGGLVRKLTGFAYSDESAAILCGSLLFLIPSDNNKKILEWEDTQKLPWGILLLFGGGLALADVLEKGGVIEMIASSFQAFNALPYLLLILLLVVISVFGSEVISNTAQVTIMIPIIGKFAIDSGYPILQLSFAVTMAASCAFMLPMGTPPNAIIFSSGQIKMHQMAGYGLGMNIVSVLLITFFSWIFVG